MKTTPMKVACGAIAAVLMAGTLGTTASAFSRMIDPNTLPPKARQYALHGNLGDRDPYGRPARAGCTWSRLQVPTSQGLRWVAQEDCDPDFW